MKKFIALLLAGVLCFCLAACGGKTEPQQNESTEQADTSEQAETTEEIKTTEQAQDSSELTAENIIVIEGEKYALPMPAETLLDNGWEMPEDAMSEVRAAGDGAQYFFDLEKNGETKMQNPGFFNNSASETTLDKCDIISLNLLGINNESSSYVQCSFTLPGGITENSTYEDVLAIFGTEEAPKEGYKITDDYDTASQDAELFEKNGFGVTVSGKYSDGVHPYNYYFDFNADKTIKEVEIESINYQSAALSAF